MSGSERVRGRRGLAAVALASLLGLAASACAGSGFHYVENTRDKAYFKVPDSWRVFDYDEILDSQKDLTEEELAAARANLWQVGFDAARRPSLEHLLTASGRPNGLAVVRPLTSDEQDTMSNQSLRNLYVDLDTMLDDGSAQLLSYEPVTFQGGFHGVKLQARVDINERGGQVTLAQIAVVDQATTKLYLFAITCRSNCFEQHRKEIDEVIDSWTVRGD